MSLKFTYTLRIGEKQELARSIPLCPIGSQNQYLRYFSIIYFSVKLLSFLFIN
jgi:hypothetical protein